MNKKDILNNGIYVIGSTILTLGCVGANNIMQARKISKEEFADKYVCINREKIPLQEFYENVRYKKDHWQYIDRKGNAHSIDELSDFIHKYNKVKGEQWQKIQKGRYLLRDTVYYTKTSIKQADGKYHIYRNKCYKILPSMPKFGASYPNGMVITQFEAFNSPKSDNIEKLNNEYNATIEHEEQHNINADPGKDLDNPTHIGQLGQNYELLFAEFCWDEIIANIKQCLKQRQNYLDYNRDTTRITARFKNYSDAITSNLVTPTYGKIKETEKEIIANTVFDGWMKEKFHLYYRKEINKTKDRYKNPYANFNAVQKDTIRHMRVLADKMHIKDKKLGIDADFYPYLFKREKEIIYRMTPEDRIYFLLLTEAKKNNITHLEELEKTRIQQGQKAYEDRIARNVKVAQTNKKMREIKDYAKEHFAYIKRILPIIER